MGSVPLEKTRNRSTRCGRSWAGCTPATPAPSCCSPLPHPTAASHTPCQSAAPSVPPWGDRQMDCHYVCHLSLGNLAKNPTEHKNRKMLFRETGYGANTTENTSRSSPTACPHKNILTASVCRISTQPKWSHLSKNPQNTSACSQAVSRSAGMVPRLQGQVCP